MYFWCEGAGGSTSFLHPFAESYERETTKGIAVIHEYVLELGFVHGIERPKPRGVRDGAQLPVKP